MNRQPIPSFDLYAELEVSRSASAATIEAAYRSIAKRVHPDVAPFADTAPGWASDGRIKRLNIAREWLTDPDLRRRYDAITAPRPARALVVPTASAASRVPAVRRAGDVARTGVGGIGINGTGVGVARAPGLPNPRPGLFRSEAERSRLLAVAGLGASSIALTAVLALAAFSGGAAQPTGGAAGGGAAAFGAPSPIGSGEPSPSSPTETPGPSLTGSPTIDPALLAELQAGAESTIRRLQRAARIGDLHTARVLLGHSAPGLTVSGLVRASFPSVAAADIAIAPAGASNGTGWVATVGTDTLTSTDGTHWTFDYGERPLAVYGRTSEHQPYFLDPSGRHEIDIRVTSVVVTRSTVQVSLAWRFPSTTDARAFAGDGLTVPSVSLGRSTYEVVGPPSVTIGGGVATATLTLSVSVAPSTSGAVDVRVLHDTGAYGSVDTVFGIKIL